MTETFKKRGIKVKKGWGHEVIFESNNQYCMKQLCFDKVGYKSSMHFHKDKTETWLCLKGAVQVELMDMKDASTSTIYINEGGVFHIDPMTPHQITCMADDTVILESSSKDTPEDNYRIRPGDSQKSREAAVEWPDNALDTFSTKRQEGYLK